MEEIKPVGIINDKKKKQIYIDKFKVSLTSDKNVQVYISRKHRKGAGKYKINNMNINNKKIVLSLDFKRDMFEAGAAVMNQRILFFKVQPNCKITKVILSDQTRK